MVAGNLKDEDFHLRNVSFRHNPTEVFTNKSKAIGSS
jgi:hypothetical protein